MACLHIHGRGFTGILNVADPEQTVTDARGKVWRFEDHRIFGPIVVNKRGDPLRNQPGPGSHFWAAYEAYAKQREAK